jgi:hypothetical protein
MNGRGGWNALLGRFGTQEIRVTVVSAFHRSEVSSHPAGQLLAPSKLMSCVPESTQKGKKTITQVLAASALVMRLGLLPLCPSTTRKARASFVEQR